MIKRFHYHLFITTLNIITLEIITRIRLLTGHSGVECTEDFFITLKCDPCFQLSLFSEVVLSVCISVCLLVRMGVCLSTCLYMSDCLMIVCIFVCLQAASILCIYVCVYTFMYVKLNDLCRLSCMLNCFPVNRGPHVQTLIQWITLLGGDHTCVLKYSQSIDIYWFITDHQTSKLLR